VADLTRTGFDISSLAVQATMLRPRSKRWPGKWPRPCSETMEPRREHGKRALEFANSVMAITDAV
jgi:hypothetical protein